MPRLRGSSVAAGVGDYGAAELPEQLGDGDGDQLGEDAGCGVEGALAGGGDGEEGEGEQADRGPAVQDVQVVTWPLSIRLPTWRISPGRRRFSR